MATAKSELIKGRWIRPQQGVAEGIEPDLPRHVAGELQDLLSGRTRRRIARLLELERQTEERIRSRWEEADAAIRRREEESAGELARKLAEREEMLREERQRARNEGRALGYQEGIEKGTQEGRRVGFEKARLEGLAEGRRQGRREEVARLRDDVREALRSLTGAAARLRRDHERLLAEAQVAVVDLVLEVAAKLVKREVKLRGDAVHGNLKKALELIFECDSITLQLHPLDVRAVEDSLQENPGLAEGIGRVDIRAAPGIARGGCRVLCGEGTVDLTLESQLALIRQALLESIEGEMADGEESAVGPERQVEVGR